MNLRAIFAGAFGAAFVIRWPFENRFIINDHRHSRWSLIIGTEKLSGEAYGKQRFKEIIARAASSGPQAVLEAVFESLQAFRGPAAQADDVTLVLVQLD